MGCPCPVGAPERGLSPLPTEVLRCGYVPPHEHVTHPHVYKTCVFDAHIYACIYIFLICIFVWIYRERVPWPTAHSNPLHPIRGDRAPLWQQVPLPGREGSLGQPGPQRFYCVALPTHPMPPVLGVAKASGSLLSSCFTGHFFFTRAC